MWRMVWLCPLLLVACGSRGIQVEQKKKETSSVRGTTPVLEVGTKQSTMAIGGIALKSCSDPQGLDVTAINTHTVSVHYTAPPAQPDMAEGTSWVAFAWVNSSNGAYFGRNWAYLYGGSATLQVPSVLADTEFEIRVYPRESGPYELVSRCRWVVNAAGDLAGSEDLEDSGSKMEVESIGLKVKIGDMELNGSTTGVGYLVRFPKGTKSFSYETSDIRSVGASCEFHSMNGDASVETTFPYEGKEEIKNGRGKVCISCYKGEGEGLGYEGLCVEAIVK